MSRPIELASDLAADGAAVWQHAGSMPGVNQELMPLVRMTYPAGAESLEGIDVPLGETLFSSVLLLGGVLPFDVHFLRLLSVESGRGFDEHSSSLMHSDWLHTRTLESLPGGGCRVRDAVDFMPRLPFLKPLLVPVVRAVFRWRHRRLRKKFGALR
ncbi:MAG: hypothetical protein GC168_17645 [Candidatus Hydrogenedens sp.]|nr:hypothetical protein [Candidatus Hydrogenedens sp.]